MKYIKQLVRKLNNRKGFSFTELLACTLIMVLATSILTGTVGLAVKHYDDQIRQSKADVLCESLAYALREKLSYVYKYDSTVSGKCKYYSTSSDLGYYPFTVDTVTVDDHDEIKLTYYSSTGNKVFPLVSTSSYIEGEYSAYCTITHGTGDDICFNVLVGVENSKTGDKLSEISFNVNPFITEVPDIK